MGLGIAVGGLPFLKEHDDEGYAYALESFAAVNCLLRRHGLPEHCEPLEFDENHSWEMYGYAGLHYLRRIAVGLALKQELPPPTAEVDVQDALFEQYYSLACDDSRPLQFLHLCNHSDAEGFYVPIDFERPLFPEGDDENGVAGWLGSTQRLKAECEALAQILGIPAGLDCDDEDLMDAMEVQRGRPPMRTVWRRPWSKTAPAAEEALWPRYAIETYICIRLLAACDVSLASGAAIQFC